jgi:hypothetical protein
MWGSDWRALIASVDTEDQSRNAGLVSEIDHFSREKVALPRLDKVADDGIRKAIASIRSRNYTRHNRHLMMNRYERKS